jgi:hypothetical protein
MAIGTTPYTLNDNTSVQLIYALALSCTKDGRRPPGVGLQEQASNCPVLLHSKGVVVNV